MRVLVTGATGFIGSFVVRDLLSSGCEVHVLVEAPAPLGRIEDLSSRLTVHRGDLLDAESLRAVCDEARPEICIHLAWYAVPGKYLHAEENISLVQASVDLYRAATRAGCQRFVGVGTCIEYDTTFGWLREEATPIRPRTLYAVCKNALHGILGELAPRDGVSFAWLRLFFLYGPTEAPGRLVSDSLAKLLRGEEAPFTSGEQVRDFMHVADMARAIAHVAKSDAVGAVNVGSGVPVMVRDVVRAMGQATGRSDLLRIGAVPQRVGDPPFLCADVTKLRDLGFTSHFGLESGLADTVSTMRQRGVAT
jgi:nucleoside-diphosphate-sugar epimerase